MKYLKQFAVIWAIFCIITACNSSEQKLGIGSLDQFLQWPAKQQAKYFNELGPAPRMNLMSEILRSGGEFITPPYYEVKFFSDGEFIYDEFNDDRGYVGGNKKDNNFKFIIGHWDMIDDKIKLTGNSNQIPIYNKGETWVDVVAEVYQDNTLVFSPKVEINNSTDIQEGTMIFKRNLNSPAIRAYTELKMKSR